MCVVWPGVRHSTAAWLAGPKPWTPRIAALWGSLSRPLNTRNSFAINQNISEPFIAPKRVASEIRRHRGWVGFRKLSPGSPRRATPPQPGGDRRSNWVKQSKQLEICKIHKGAVSQPQAPAHSDEDKTRNIQLTATGLGLLDNYERTIGKEC